MVVLGLNLSLVSGFLVDGFMDFPACPFCLSSCSSSWFLFLRSRLFRLLNAPSSSSFLVSFMRKSIMFGYRIANFSLYMLGLGGFICIVR